MAEPIHRPGKNEGMSSERVMNDLMFPDNFQIQTDVTLQANLLDEATDSDEEFVLGFVIACLFQSKNMLNLFYFTGLQAMKVQATRKFTM